MIVGQMNSILQDLPDSIIAYFYYLEVLYFLALQHHHVQSASFCPSMQSLHQQKYLLFHENSLAVFCLSNFLIFQDKVHLGAKEPVLRKQVTSTCFISVWFYIPTKSIST